MQEYNDIFKNHFKNDNMTKLTESEIWDFVKKNEVFNSNLDLKYYIDSDYNIVCYMFDEINLFIITNEGEIQWLSPASSLTDPVVEYSNTVIVQFLKEKEFEVSESENGKILAKAPMGL